MEGLMLTVRARRLMKELRQLRMGRKMTVAAAADRLGISEPTLWRMENGRSRITAEVLVAALDLYDVRSPKREALERLSLDAVRRGWWAPYRDVFVGSYVALESGAAQITVNAFVVPGFFQTPDYARAAIATTRPEMLLGEVERRVEARLARQRALFTERRDRPAVRLMLDESAVRRQVGGPAAMREQLGRLLDEAGQQGTTIQVMPFTAGGHPGMEGEFVIIDFADPEDDPFVYEEGLFGDVYIDAPEDIARYRLAYDHATADLALAEAASLDLIRSVRGEL